MRTSNLVFVSCWVKLHLFNITLGSEQTVLPNSIYLCQFVDAFLFCFLPLSGLAFNSVPFCRTFSYGFLTLCLFLWW
jgi:hypothetical protein